MADTAQTRSGWLRRTAIIGAWTIGIVLTLLAAFVGVALVVLSGQTGRDLVDDLVDGRQIAGYGEIQISDLSGNPLDRLTIGSLTLADQDGVWLEVEDLVLNWRPRSLLSRHIDVQALTAERIAMLHQPTRAEREQGGGGGLPNWTISVGELDLDTIRIAEAVTGQEARLTAQGSLSRSGRGWQASLDVQRTDSGEDRILVEALIGEDVLDVDAQLIAPAGGPLTALMRTRDSRIEADLTLSGTDEDGTGQLEVRADGEAAITGEMGWEAGLLEIEAQARPARWPGLDMLDELLGGSGDLSLAVRLRQDSLFKPDLSAVTARIRAPRLSADISRAGSDQLAVTVNEAAGLVTQLTNERVQAGSLTAEGILTVSGDRSFEGEVAAQELNLGFARFGRVRGPVTVTGPLSRPDVVTVLESENARFDNAQLQAALGASPSVDAHMIYSRETGDLSFEALTLSGEGGEIEAQGLLNPGSGSFSARLTESRIEVGAFRPDSGGTLRLTGQASGEITGPLDFSLTADGSEFSGQLETLLGDRLDANAEGRWQGGRNVALTRLEAQSPTLQLDVTGAYEGEGWQAQGDALWTGALPVSAVAMDGQAAIAFDASMTGNRLDARAQIETDAVSAGPVNVRESTLRIEAAGPLDALSGEWRLTGSMDRGALDLAGDFSREGDRVRLPGIDGRFGAFAIDGELSAAPASMDFDLTAEPIAGFGQFAAQGRLEDGRLDVTVTADDLIQGDMVYLDSLEATLAGPLEAVDLTLQSEGAYGARFTLNADGQLRLAGGPLLISVAPSGQYGNVEIATREDITVSREGGATSVSGALSVGEGGIVFGYGRQQSVPVLTASFEALPARLLSYRRSRPPMGGTLYGEARLELDPAGWTGNVDIEGRSLKPRLSEDGPALDLTLDANLGREQLNIDVEGAAPGVEMSARFDLSTGLVTAVSDLTADDTVLDGRIFFDGEIAPLAAFMLPPGRRLEGQVDAGARFDGTIGSPNFRGVARLREGSFVDDTAGLQINDVSGVAEFQNDGITLSRIEGQGPDGGTLTGSGQFSFAGAQVNGEASFDFTDFTLMSRPDLAAVGSGDVTLALADREMTVSGETRLREVEARPPSGGQDPIPHIQVTEVNVPGQGETQMVPEPSPGISVVLDYDIEANNQVFVRGQSFDTEWSLDIHVAGSPGNLDLEGEARLIRGSASLLGQRFTFDRGVVTLDGEPAAAELNIVAVRQARDITARIVIGGTARAPTINLESSPSLPDDEIASRLLFGQGAGDLSGVQAAQLAGALAGAAGGFDPFSALRGLTGFDQLSIVSGNDGGTVVSGGRYITDDVYLEIASASGGAAPTTRIEWALTQRFSLESELSASGQAGIAISWRRDYDSLDEIDW